ncbi:helix-turn-helix domain-containing protein [Mycobacterium hackensackense]|uniref:helix-turn-helix domain-containing protein n=1 Tax=Mycobacterium hackensackense TaxID=228909 RepID=UPI003556E64A
MAVEAAEHAKVSAATIREAVKSGELPAYAVGRSGRQYRIRAEDVDALDDVPFLGTGVGATPQSMTGPRGSKCNI